ncbi:MAG: AraC family transcriptional regulator [Lachnospiraceae bacterium]|nr:AraC family transcriptional regulator [Lachnospiraceae bacterium]
MGDRIQAERVHRESGYVMGSYHCHSFYELYYVEQGACRFLIEDSMIDLHAGDFLLIPPRMLHYTRYLLGACRRVIVFFGREHLEEETIAQMPRGEAFFSDMRIMQIPDAYAEQISGHLTRMITEGRINDARSAPILRAQLQELLLICSRIGTFLQDTPANIHTTDRQILTAARFISSHYASEIRTSDVAAAAGFSQNYLTRRFREAAGIGVHEYLVFIRLQHAALELVSTGDSITDIALRCGFSDGNYFKDAFKKKYGVTPRAYRKGAGDG